MSIAMALAMAVMMFIAITSILIRCTIKKDKPIQEPLPTTIVWGEYIPKSFIIINNITAVYKDRVYMRQTVTHNDKVQEGWVLTDMDESIIDLIKRNHAEKFRMK